MGFKVLASLCPKCRSYNRAVNMGHDKAQEKDDWWCQECGTIWRQERRRPWSVEILSWGKLEKTWPSWWQTQKMIWEARMRKYWRKVQI